LAIIEWFGRGSIPRDALDREFIDVLGGFGIYSPGICYPKIVAAAYDSRTLQGMAVIYATTPKHGDHTVGWVVVDGTVVKVFQLIFVE